MRERSEKWSGPIVDNHFHLNRSGRFLEAAKDFKNAGGTTENIAFKAKIAYSRRHWKTPGTKKLRLTDVQEAMAAHFTAETDVPLNMYL